MKNIEKLNNSEKLISEELSELKKGIEEYKGPKLTKSAGRIKGPSGVETWYDLPMDTVITNMKHFGFSMKDYRVREDGVKMLGKYVMVAADLKIRPRGTKLPTSLGEGIVVDTGSFTAKNPKQLDIAVAWKSSSKKKKKR